MRDKGETGVFGDTDKVMRAQHPCCLPRPALTTNTVVVVVVVVVIDV